MGERIELNWLQLIYFLASIHMDNVLIAGVVIEQDGKYLLVQERKPSAYGLWNLPAGKADEGETVEVAAVREAKEETGYDVKLIKKLEVYHSTLDSRQKHAFIAEIVGGNLSFPIDELLDAQWFTYEEIQKMKDNLRDPPFVLRAIEATIPVA